MNNETDTTPASTPETPATPQTGTEPSQTSPAPQSAGTDSEQTPRPHPDMSSIYPTPAEHHAPAVSQPSWEENQTSAYAQAGQGVNEAIVLITGLLSSACSVLLLYVLKNSWATIICSTILAVVAIVFAFKNHRAGAAMSPMSVIGISAATITVVGSLNLLTSQAIIRAMFPY